MAKDSPQSTTNRAQLIVVSRHFVKFLDNSKIETTGVFASRGMKAVVGDIAIFSFSEDQKREDAQHTRRTVIEEILPRKNCFKRSYGNKTKELSANLDRLFVVTAPSPLFNTFAIDRVLASAHAESIPCTLVVNKCDLCEELKLSRSLISIYQQLSIPIIEVSVVQANMLEPLHAELRDPNLTSAALIGVSGVGKSSILNEICPSANARTGEMSERTGKGRQTTSMAKGFYYSRNNAEDLLMIDLPGIQNFGISHLSREEVKASFCEFQEFSQECRFSNCFHIEEPNCAVLGALESGKIGRTRYESYLDMLEELRRFAI